MVLLKSTERLTTRCVSACGFSCLFARILNLEGAHSRVSLKGPRFCAILSGTARSYMACPLLSGIGWE